MATRKATRKELTNLIEAFDDVIADELSGKKFDDAHTGPAHDRKIAELESRRKDAQDDLDALLYTEDEFEAQRQVIRDLTAQLDAANLVLRDMGRQNYKAEREAKIAKARQLTAPRINALINLEPEGKVLKVYTGGKWSNRAYIGVMRDGQFANVVTVQLREVVFDALLLAGYLDRVVVSQGLGGYRGSHYQLTDLGRTTIRNWQTRNYELAAKGAK